MKKSTHFIAVTAVTLAAFTVMASPATAQSSVTLAHARLATARYHLSAVATAEGFVAEHECVADESGGMGQHWGNFSRIDGHVDARAPEVLLYEPGPIPRLVGLEYVAIAPVGSPPTLFGQKFAQGPEIGEGLAIHALHVWLWRYNPAGMFADYNPNVRCPT